MVRADAGASVLAEARELFAALRWRQCAERLIAADAREPLDGEGLAAPGRGGLSDRRRRGGWRRHSRGPTSASWTPATSAAAARSALSSAFVLENAGERVRSVAWVARAERLVEEHDLGGAEAAWLSAHRAHTWSTSSASTRRWRTALEGERAGSGRRRRRRRRPLPGDDRLRRTCCVASARRRSGCSTRSCSRSPRTRPRPRWSASATACRSPRACSCGTSSGRGPGPPRWTAGAPRVPTSSPTAGRAWCTARRCPPCGGNWSDALARGGDGPASCSQGPAAGQAAYQLGELHRLMGADREAEDAYRRANALGIQPEPGLSRLRIAQGPPGGGRHDPAAAVRRGRGRPPTARSCSPRGWTRNWPSATSRPPRPRPASCARSPRSWARRCCAGSPTRPRGRYCSPSGRPDAALEALRRAQQRWTELELPHACAQVRALAGRCLRALGDQDAADLEFEAARECFERLGAARDLAGLDDAARPDGPAAGGRAGSPTVRWRWSGWSPPATPTARSPAGCA